MIPQIHNEFIEQAKNAVTSGRMKVAIILISTTIEHLLNIYYRQLLLFKELSPETITDIIRRTNVESKIGWLNSLTGQFEIPQDIGKQIKELFELRNAIVHYKAFTPCDVDDETEAGI